MESIEMLRTLFFNPTAFFSAVKKESDYWPSMRLFAILYLISNAVFFVPFVFVIPFIPGLMGFGVLISFVIFFVGSFFLLIYAFLTPWIYAFFTYLGVLVFGGRDKYFFPTFKASTYGLCIMLLYAILINVLFVFFGIIFLISFITTGAGEPAQAVGVFGMIIFIILFLLLLLIGFIHRVYATMVGLSLYNNMTYGKSFLAVIFIPAAIFIMYVIFIIATILSGGY